MGIELVKLLLPEELLNHFKITGIRELGEIASKTMYYEIDLEEKNIVPSGHNACLYESKGFTSTSRVQDFPLRGKAVYLNIKRRRWRNKGNKKEVIKSNFSFIAGGAKLTQELSGFLKSVGQYERRYD